MKFNFIEILREREKSVYWLSKQTEISESLLNFYKVGKVKKISLENAFKIAKALGVKIDDLIEEDED